MVHPNVERVQAALAAQGLTAQVVELADSTRTAAEAAAAIGTTVAQIAKSLVFLMGDEASETPVLVIASGVNRVDTSKIARHLGTNVRQANADVVKRLTGFSIGGVAPVGHTTAPRAIIDRELFQYADIWAAAGTPHAVFRTTAAELARISNAETLDVREESS
ncbi:MAG TPA: YbaK/EbsC family protein [Ktedonobacterales bacterium]|nr:YbaK/EbsC family protein [Ktedonobacterales bacterium]